MQSLRYGFFEQYSCTCFLIALQWYGKRFDLVIRGFLCMLRLVRHKAYGESVINHASVRCAGNDVVDRVYERASGELSFSITTSVK